MREIPTVLVSQLSHGDCDECDHGFIVMNRPWGLRQFMRSDAARQIVEDYLFVVETDHLLLRPLPNKATESSPVGFGFYYMTYKYDPPKLRPVIAKYHDPNGVDPVGPSPVIIHKATLSGLVEPWWKLCLELKRDSVADGAFGWVLEMWGYAIISARRGIRHQVLPVLQAEPGGPGMRGLERYYIYHYTFDLDYVGRRDWSGGGGGRYQWSKRRFMASYPPRLAEPPAGAASSTPTFVKMMNEAIDAIAASSTWGPLRRH